MQKKIKKKEYNPYPWYDMNTGKQRKEFSTNSKKEPAILRVYKTDNETKEYETVSLKMPMKWRYECS